MGKTQQTLWLAGFTGLSVTCMTSFLFSVAHLDDPASAPRQAPAFSRMRCWRPIQIATRPSP